MCSLEGEVVSLSSPVAITHDVEVILELSAIAVLLLSALGTDKVAEPFVLL